MLKYSIITDDCVGNLEPAYINTAELPVFVFINGAGTGPWMWENQTKSFVGIKVVFDLPGHDTNKEIDFISIEHASDLVIELIHHITDRKVNIIGHSIGAQIILHILEKYPEVIDKAFVISALNMKINWLNSIISPMVKLSLPLAKKRWFAKLQAMQLGIGKDMFEKYFISSQSVSYQNLTDILKSNMNYEFFGTKVAGDNVHFIYGSKEARMMAKSAEKGHKLIKNSHILKLSSGHDIPYRCAEELNTYILEHLD